MARIIKRYENRKLYDAEDRKYVSLEEIAALVRKGNEVQVIDKATNSDITTQTLTQVIFEEGKKGRNPLSKEILHDAIRLGANIIDGGLQQMRKGLEQFVPQSINKILGNPDPEEVKELKKRVESLEKVINDLAGQEKLNRSGDDRKTNER